MVIMVELLTLGACERSVKLDLGPIISCSRELTVYPKADSQSAFSNR